MLFTLLLFSSLSFAEDLASEKYCFPGISGMQTARQKFAGIQVPSDEVTVDENCLMIKMRPHRRELIQRFFMTTIPGTTVQFSSEEMKREPCLLKVEKIKVKKNENTTIGLNQSPSVEQTERNENTNETLHIQTLKDFELSVDQDQIRGQCRFIHSNRYEITIEVRKNPKPIIPVGLPPGTIVTITEPPKDQETMVLQTQLILTKGERVELGGVVKELRDKNREISIDPELKMNTENREASEKVFLALQ